MCSTARLRDVDGFEIAQGQKIGEWLQRASVRRPCSSEGRDQVPVLGMQIDRAALKGQQLRADRVSILHERPNELSLWVVYMNTVGDVSMRFVSISLAAPDNSFRRGSGVTQNPGRYTGVGKECEEAEVATHWLSFTQTLFTRQLWM